MLNEWLINPATVHTVYEEVCTVCTVLYVRHEILPTIFFSALCLYSNYIYRIQNDGKDKRNMLPYITVVDGVHGQQVVAMAKLEMDDLQSGLDISHLSAVSGTTLPHHVMKQQAVFTDPLHGLQ